VATGEDLHSDEIRTASRVAAASLAVTDGVRGANPGTVTVTPLPLSVVPDAAERIDAVAAAGAADQRASIQGGAESVAVGAPAGGLTASERAGVPVLDFSTLGVSSAGGTVADPSTMLTARAVDSVYDADGILITEQHVREAKLAKFEQVPLRSCTRCRRA
jgi:hypothetical protein